MIIRELCSKLLLDHQKDLVTAKEFIRQLKKQQHQKKKKQFYFLSKQICWGKLLKNKVDSDREFQTLRSLIELSESLLPFILIIRAHILMIKIQIDFKY